MFPTRLVLECRFPTVHIRSIFSDVDAAQQKTIRRFFNLRDFYEFLTDNYWRSSTRMVSNFSERYSILLIDCVVWRKLNDYVYITTHNRFSPWLIGLNFGQLLLKHRPQKLHIPRVWINRNLLCRYHRQFYYFYFPFQYLNLLALCGSFVLMVAVIYVFKYSADNVAILWSSRIVWSLAMCYIIFACIHCGGIVNWFLSLPQWQLLSRLSYITYLIHPTVIIVIYVNTQNGIYFSKLAFVG